MSILGALDMIGGLFGALGKPLSVSPLTEQQNQLNEQIFKSGLANAHMAAQANQQYLSQALQNQNWQLQQSSAAQSQMGAAWPTGMLRVNIAEAKAQLQINRLVDQLPMSIARHIINCVFYTADQDGPACFTIVFDNGHTVKFDDIDAFPCDEHIARIALDCP